MDERETAITQGRICNLFDFFCEENSVSNMGLQR